MEINKDVIVGLLTGVVTIIILCTLSEVQSSQVRQEQKIDQILSTLNEWGITE